MTWTIAETFKSNLLQMRTMMTPGHRVDQLFIVLNHVTFNGSSPAVKKECYPRDESGLS
jgi:hypothetical protein